MLPLVAQTSLPTHLTHFSPVEVTGNISVSGFISGTCGPEFRSTDFMILLGMWLIFPFSELLS